MAARTPRTTSPQDETVTASDPFSSDIFDAVSFPSRGKNSGEAGEFADQALSAIDRRGKAIASGVAPEKVITVIDLRGADGSPWDSKSVESYRSKLGNALKKLGGEFKLEWRSIPEQPEARKAKYVAYEQAFGTEISNATHCFRLIPTNGTDPQAPVVAETTGE